MGKLGCFNWGLHGDKWMRKYFKMGTFFVCVFGGGGVGSDQGNGK